MILQNAPGEGHGLFADVLDKEGWDQQVIHLYLDEPVPPDWEQSSLLVIMGGPMNVYEEREFPFLSVETATEKGSSIISCLSLYFWFTF